MPSFPDPAPTARPPLPGDADPADSPVTVRPRPFPYLPAVVVGAALFLTVLWLQSGRSRLWHHDEILTAVRAREMLRSGDPWTVRVNGRPNFHKPPLQYWLTAVLLRLMPDAPERAVRLPTAVAATLCLVATAALGRVAWPDDPLAGPAAAAALAGCGFYVHFARMGMLDAGAALAVAGTLLGAEWARRRRDPRGWGLTAAAAVLGTWQKAPYALGVWAVSLLGRRRAGELPPWPRALRVAAPAALALVLVWPALQVARYGADAVLAGHSDSTGNLLNFNKSAGFQPWLYLWWLVRDWGLFGLCVPLATGAALWRRRSNPADPFRWELALMLTLGWGVVACLPYRTERYLVFLLPVAALGTMRWFRRDGAGRPRRFGGTLLLVALLSTVPGAVFHYRKSFPSRDSLLTAARAFGATCAADPAVVPVLDRALPSGINVPGFTQFYGDLDRRAFVFEGWTQSAFVRGDQRRQGERLLGLSRPEVAAAFGPVREVARHGEWLIWELGP